MSDAPPYLTEEYLAKVRAFLTANRIQFVDSDDLAQRHYLNTLPWVDPRSLIYAPSVDVEDFVRDALLLKLAGLGESPTLQDLRRVQSVFAKVMLSLSGDFVLSFMREVKR